MFMGLLQVVGGELVGDRAWANYTGASLGRTEVLQGSVWNGQQTQRMSFFGEFYTLKCTSHALSRAFHQPSQLCGEAGLCDSVHTLPTDGQTEQRLLPHKAYMPCTGRNRTGRPRQTEGWSRKGNDVEASAPGG